MVVQEISSWTDLVSKQRPNRMYRGQSDATWQLSTSLERACMANDGSLGIAADRERRLLLSFKRNYHEFTWNTPEADDELRWLSIMQHHGAPTRLTDWSYSLLVATYFAVEDANSKSAVWQIDTDWLSEASRGSLASNGINSVTPDDLSLAVHLGKVTAEDAKLRFRNWFLSNKYRFAKMTPPYVKDRRLTAQQGQFICPGDVSVPFMENLMAMDPPSEVITK